MENTTSKKGIISKLLMFLGVIILVISVIDLLDLYFPLKLSNQEWVYMTTQSIISSILVPAICIIFILTGLYLIQEDSPSKKSFIFEKITAIVSIVFGVALSANLLLYSLSIKSYELKIVSAIQGQQEQAMKQIDEIKKSGKFNIPEDVIQKKVTEINKAVTQQIKYTKKTLMIKNIKAIVELVLYIILYIGIGQIAFSSSKKSLLKSKFQNS